jgi:hypothetical protein
MPLGTSMMMSKGELIASEADRLFRMLQRLRSAIHEEGPGAKLDQLTLHFTTTVENITEDLDQLTRRVKATDLPIKELGVSDTVLGVDEHRRTLIIYVNFT